MLMSSVDVSTLSRTPFHSDSIGLKPPFSFPPLFLSFKIRFSYNVFFSLHELLPEPPNSLRIRCSSFFLTRTISYMSILNLGHFYSILPSLPPLSLLFNPPLPTSLSLIWWRFSAFFFSPTEFNQGCWHECEWGLFTRARATFQLFHHGRKWQSSLNTR